MSTSPYQYLSYDLLTGNLIGQFPMRGVSFGQQLNTPGALKGTIDLEDPRVQATNPIQCTAPNRTMLVVDYGGAIIWAGITQSRRWTVNNANSSTERTLEITGAELWAYFQQRVQATDYSAPPFSGISGGSPMTYWTATPWDSGLIATQIISDAIGYADSSSQPAGNPLGGLTILYNGATPSAGSPVVPSGDYIAVNYPFTSLQTVDTIVTQLSQLGLGIGFDFGVDVVYSAGTGSSLVGTVNISYPRRGRTATQNGLMVDLTTARTYQFPEDGTQTANQVYELGGSSAIVVSGNVNPINQGYPIWERVFSRANAQSANMLNLLSQTGLSDLAMFSYALGVPTVTLGANDTNLPLGSFSIGDDIQLYMPAQAGDTGVFDPRFPAGLNQEWRIVQWQANLTDEGDATVTLTLNPPPFTAALTPPF